MPNVLYIPRKIIKVEEIIVEGNDSGEVGSQIQLTAIVLPTNATNKIVFWSSSDETKATVDQNGHVELLAEGNVTITATAQDGSGVSGSKVLSITIPVVLVTSISITGDSTGVAGNTIQLTALITPSNASNKTVIWSSSDTSIATVNSSGLVTLIAAGNVTITATAQDGSGVSGSKELTITPAIVLPTVLTINPASVSYTTATVGGNVTSAGNGTVLERGIEYSTNSNFSTKTIKVLGSGTGTFSTGLTSLNSNTTYYVRAYATNEAGTAYGDVLSFNTLIYISSINVYGSDGAIGDIIRLIPSISPANATNKSLNWFISDTSKASFSAVGDYFVDVQLLELGSFQVTAHAVDGSGVIGSYSITVSEIPSIPVTSISISGASSGVAGTTIQLTATVLPSTASNKEVVWSSSDTSKATVSSTGLVQLIAAGAVTITATATDGSGVSASKALTITAATVSVTSISISGASSGVAGSTIQLTATVLPSNASNKNVSWGSEDASKALVSSSGLVTLLEEGEVIITVSAQDGSGATASKNITITASAVAVTGISISGASTGEVGTTIQLTAYITPLNATNQSVSWSSSDTSKATVNSSGLVTLIAEGPVTITAMAQDGSNVSASKALTITAAVIPVTSISISGNNSGVAGTTIQLTANVQPSNASNAGVSWSSSDTSKATVNSAGLVTLIAEGPVTITATAQDGSGVSASKGLTITAAVVPVTDPAVFTYEKQSSLSEIVSSVEISADGNYLYLLYPSLQVIRRYTLTTPFDISTKSTYQEYDYSILGDTGSFEGGLFLSPDQKKISFCIGNKIKTIVFNTANDLSSELYVNSHTISEGTFAVSGVTFDVTGTICSVQGQMSDSSKRIYVYSTSSANQLSGTVTLLHFAVISSASKPTGFEFNADGTAYYIADLFNNQLNKYLISGNSYTPNNINVYGTSTINASYTIATGGKTIVDFCFSNDLQKMYVIGRDGSGNYFVLQYALS